MASRASPSAHSVGTTKEVLMLGLSSCRVLIVFACVVVGPVATAGAHTNHSGGTRYGERPVVRVLECISGEQSRCARGQLLRVRGERLAQADSVMFLGRAGRADDRRARPDERSPHRVVVRVPDDARSGPVRVSSRADGRSRESRRLRVTVPSLAPLVAVAVPPGEGVFPVRGRYDFGTRVNGFGGGRGHGGQDVLARCSTPIVAARSGDVSAATFQSRAGNYVVITADDGTSQAYMHLRGRPGLARGERVAAGQPIGRVGRSGRASACHLHYESWTAPGWQSGGTAIDPLPELQQFAARG